MSERVPMSGIHKKCGKEGTLFRSVGGDLMYWCDYCGEQLQDPEKEILSREEYFANLRQWRNDLDKDED